MTTNNIDECQVLIMRAGAEVLITYGEAKALYCQGKLKYCCYLRRMVEVNHASV